MKLSTEENTKKAIVNHECGSLLVFGSTGGMGRQLVNQALERGHTVTAFARDATKVDIKHDNLQVAQGDAMDPASVETAVRGHEAVLCSLGAGLKRNLIRSEGTRNIINAMEKAVNQYHASHIGPGCVRCGTHAMVPGRGAHRSRAARKADELRSPSPNSTRDQPWSFTAS